MSAFKSFSSGWMDRGESVWVSIFISCNLTCVDVDVGMVVCQVVSVGVDQGLDWF